LGKKRERGAGQKGLGSMYGRGKETFGGSVEREGNPKIVESEGVGQKLY